MKEKDLLSKILDQATNKYETVRKIMDIVSELTRDPFKTSTEKPAIEAMKLTLEGKTPEEVKEEIERQRELFYEQQRYAEEQDNELQEAENPSKGYSLNSQEDSVKPSLETSLNNSKLKED